MRRIVLTAVVVTLAGCSSLRDTGSIRFVGNVWPSGLREDADFLLYWNQLTPENAGKWGSVEGERDVMRWEELDAAYAFSRANRIPFRLHTLIWGRSQPPWLGSLSPEEARGELEEWFRALALRYPDVEMIDVVNEPLHSPPPYQAALGGAGATRFDWVITAFRLAREAFPRALLGLNEYGVLEAPDAAEGLLRLVRLLVDRGLIDSIGVQAHGLEDVPDAVISAGLRILAESGLPIYVTELDLAIADDTAQAERMRDLLKTFARSRQVQGVTLWGYREGATWRKSAFLLRADGEGRPALDVVRRFSRAIRARSGR